MADNDIRVDLRAEFDKKSEAELKRFGRLARGTVADFKSDIVKATTATQQFDRELRKLAREKAVAALNEDFKRSVREGENATVAVKKLRQELERIGASKGEIRSAARAVSEVGNAAQGAPAAGGGGGGRRGNALRQAGTALFRAPSVQLGGGISTDVIGRAAQGLGRLGVSLTTLGGAALVAAPLVIGLSIAARKAAEAARKHRDELEGAAAGIKRYFEIIQEGTTDVIKSELVGLEGQIATAEAAKARFEELKADADRILRGNLPGIRGDIIEGLATDVRVVSDLSQLVDDDVRRAADAQKFFKDSAEGANRELEIAKGLHDALTKVLGSENVAANDLIASLQQLVEDTNATSDQFADFKLDAFIKGKDATAESIRDQIADIELEILARQRLIAQGGLTTEKLKEFTEEIGALSDQAIALRSLALGPAESREAAANAAAQAEELAALQLQKRQAALDSLQKREQEAIASIQKFKDEIGAINAKLSEATAKIAQQISDAVSRAQAQEAEQIAKAQQTASDARLDLQISTDERLLRLTEQRAIREEQIKRRFSRSAAEAIQSRDAVAFERAKQQRDDALKDLETQQDDQKKVIERNARERLRVIQRRLRQELEAARDNAAKSIALARQNGAQRLAELRRQAAAEIALRQSEINTQAALLTAARNRRLQILQADVTATAVATSQISLLWQGMLSRIRSTLTTTASALRPQILTSPTQLVRPGGIAINPFAAGGPFRAGQTMLVGERGPEIVRFNRGGSVTPNGGGGGTAILNINGATERTVQVTSKKEALKVLTEFVMEDAAAAGVL